MFLAAHHQAAQLLELGNTCASVADRRPSLRPARGGFALRQALFWARWLAPLGRARPVGRVQSIATDAGPIFFKLLVSYTS